MRITFGDARSRPLRRVGAPADVARRRVLASAVTLAVAFSASSACAENAEQAQPAPPPARSVGVASFVRRERSVMTVAAPERFPAAPSAAGAVHGEPELGAISPSLAATGGERKRRRQQVGHGAVRAVLAIEAGMTAPRLNAMTASLVEGTGFAPIDMDVFEGSTVVHENRATPDTGVGQAWVRLSGLIGLVVVVAVGVAYTIVSRLRRQPEGQEPSQPWRPLREEAEHDAAHVSSDTDSEQELKGPASATNKAMIVSKRISAVSQCSQTGSQNGDPMVNMGSSRSLAESMSSMMSTRSQRRNTDVCVNDEGF